MLAMLVRGRPKAGRQGSDDRTMSFRETFQDCLHIQGPFTAQRPGRRPGWFGFGFFGSGWLGGRRLTFLCSLFSLNVNRFRISFIYLSLIASWVLRDLRGF